jgi:hypothetical protein
MKTGRRAYAIIELLSIIAAVVVLMALSVQPMRTVLLEIPQTDRDFQAWVQTMGMLERLKADMEQSARLRVFEIDPRIGGSLLYLERPEGLVSFSLENGRVHRQSGLSNDSFGPSVSWDLPNVQMSWRLWEKNNVPYALEIRTWNQRIVLGNKQKKYEQSCIYFLGNLK